MKKICLLILALHFVPYLFAQSPLIQLSNPSFEDVPGPGRPPLGWYFCGPPEETPPDVHPVPIMSVTQLAFHGKTYAGLVTRDNGTVETLAQALDQELKAGNCYLLQLYASRSSIFSSYSRLKNEPADFLQPIKLQVWAGNQHGKSVELLAETPLISDTTWQMHSLKFSPKANYHQLFFTAAREHNSIPYNGHLLLDHLSPIILLDCTTGASLAIAEEKESLDLAVNNYGDLKISILEQIKQLQWTRDGFSLEQNLIPVTKPSAHWNIMNKAIYQIAQELKAHPKALLTIAVGPPKDPLVQHHIRLLAAEFMAAGLPSQHCLIRPMKKRDLKRMDWLNMDTGSQDILWGLSR